MCLAIYQPAGKSIPESHLAEGFKNNPHGAGFMYFDESGALKTFRSMEFSKFIDEYEKQHALHGEHSPFSIHFRWATHGTQDISNVHPFRMNENVAVLHNGIISCEIPDSKMSDTAAFVKYYLAALPRNWQDNEYLFDMVEQYCHGSKLVIMTNDPDAQYSAYIVNESSGHWDDGVWYSNSSYSCTRSFGVVKSAKQSAMTFEDEDSFDIKACELCGEEAVYDDMCYNCESCQVCCLEDQWCQCKAAPSEVHAMTADQFFKYMEA